MAVGFALMFIAAVRTALLPAWFGWLSILIGVVAFTPAGVVAFVATPIWIVALSISMLGHGRTPIDDDDPRPEARPRSRPAIDLAARG